MTTPDQDPRQSSRSGEPEPEVATQDDPSLFEKCHRFFDPSGDYARVKEADLYPYFRPIEESEGSR
ncbi:MAG: 8-amino-7-oxononanoate synthase, partial [Bacteroidetes bacterium QH_7_64_110]